jgi:hypothetical protein
MNLKKLLSELEEMHTTFIGKGNPRSGRGSNGKLRGFEGPKVPYGARSANAWKIDGTDMSDKEADDYLTNKLKAAGINPKDMDTEEKMEAARNKKLVK